MRNKMKSEKAKGTKKSYRLYIFAAFLAVIMALSCVAIFAADSDDVAATGDNEAKIGTVEYPTLVEAIDAATNGQTVTLLKDVTGGDMITVNKGITIDLGGYTWSVNKEKGSVVKITTIAADGDVEIKNGSMAVIGAEVLASGSEDVDAIWITGTANVTLTNLNVTVETNVGACVYAGAVSTSVVTIDGGVYKNISSERYLYSTDGAPLTINIGNGGSATVLVKSGEFVGRNPELGDDSGTPSSFLSSEARVCLEITEERNLFFPHLSSAMAATTKALIGTTTEITYILLQNDVDVSIARISDANLIDSKDFTDKLTVNLNLNAKTYTASVMDGTQVKTKSIDVYPGQTWNVANGTIATSVSDIAADANNTISYQLIQSYGILNLTNVTINMSSVSHDASNKVAAIFVIAGTTTIGTGTTITMASGDVAAMTAAMLYDNGTEQNYLTNKPTLNVNGATINGDLICGVTDWRNNEDNTGSYINLVISSGTVNGAISMQKIHRNGGVAEVTLERCVIMLDDDVEGTHTVSAPISVIKTGNGFAMYYGSMDVAIDAADTGSTITLYDNVVVYEAATIEKDLTIVGNGPCSITIWKVDIRIDGEFNVTNVIPVIVQDGEFGHLYIKVTYDLNYSGSPEATSSYSEYEFDVPKEEPSGHYSLPDAPTRAGYNFIGWFTAPVDGSEVTSTTILTNTSAHTLYARWEQVYTVAIDPNIQNGNVIASPTSGEEGTTITLTVEPAEGYVLASLSYTAEGSATPVAIVGNTFDMPAANVTVTAVFEGAVARIGDVYYMTLADAIAAGGEIIIINDITISDAVTIDGATTITIPTGVTVTNNSTINVNGTTSSVIIDGGTLTSGTYGALVMNIGNSPYGGLRVLTGIVEKQNISVTGVEGAGETIVVGSTAPGVFVPILRNNNIAIHSEYGIYVVVSATTATKIDASITNNVFTSDVEIGYCISLGSGDHIWTPATSTAHVFVDVTGNDYTGVLMLTDKPDKAPVRFNARGATVGTSDADESNYVKVDPAGNRLGFTRPNAAIVESLSADYVGVRDISEVTVSDGVILTVTGEMLVKGTVINNGTIKIENDTANKAQMKLFNGSTLTATNRGAVIIDAKWTAVEPTSHPVVIMGGIFEKQDVTACDCEDDHAFMSITGTLTADMYVRNNSFEMARLNGIVLYSVSGEYSVNIVENVFESTSYIDQCVLVRSDVACSSIVIVGNDVTGVFGYSWQNSSDAGNYMIKFDKAALDFMQNAVIGVPGTADVLVQTDMPSIGVKNGASVTIASNMNLDYLGVTAGGNAVIASGKTLTCDGNIMVKGTVTNNGTIALDNKTVVFAGVGATFVAGVISCDLGYHFIEWNASADGSGDTVSELMDITAIESAAYMIRSNKYTVTLELDGGTFSETPSGWTKVDDDTYTKEFEYNAAFSFTAVPEKASTYTLVYEFSSWTPAFPTNVTADDTFTAVYTQSTRYYTVTMELDGGTFSETPSGWTKVDDDTYTRNYTYNEAFSFTAVPEKAPTVAAEYLFNAWSPVLPGVVTEAATFTATYTESARNYTVTLELDGGTFASDPTGWTKVDDDTYTKEFEYNAAFSFTAVPEKAPTVAVEYSFNVWSPAFPANVTGDATFTATYTESARNYTVTLELDGGTFSETPSGWTKVDNDTYTKEFEYNAAFSFTAVPEKDPTETTEYAFNVWSPAFPANVTGDATYTATYTESTRYYTLEVNSAAGYRGQVSLDGEAPGGSVIIINLLYNAEISISTNRLSIADKDSVVHVVVAVPSEPTSTKQYAFTGYNTTTGTKVVSNMIVYAEFSESDRQFDVSITPGSNMTKTSGDLDQTVIYDNPIGDVVFTAAEGYEFPADYVVPAVNGISVTRDSATQITVSGTPTDDVEITLPAASPIVYKAYVNANNGTTDKSSAMDVNPATMTEITLPVAAEFSQWTKVGYHMVGYSTTAAGVKELDFGQVVPIANVIAIADANRDVNIYIVWEIDTYTVTFSVDGNGTVDTTSVANVPYGSAFTVSDKTVTINGTTVTVTIGAAVEKYTYSFGGWNIKDGDTVAGDTAVVATVVEVTKPETTETAVEFISDSDDKTVTASVDDIKSSDKENVVIGKDVELTSDAANWSVEIPKSYFSDKTENVSVTVTDVSADLPDVISDDQKKKLEGMTVISLDMIIGEKTEHQFGTKVTVKLAYTLKAGQSADNLFVYYVNTESGQLEKYDVTYADGFITFETDHFSFWAVGEDNGSSSPVNDGLFLASLLVAAIILPIIAGLVIFRKK